MVLQWDLKEEKEQAKRGRTSAPGWGNGLCKGPEAEWRRARESRSLSFPVQGTFFALGPQIFLTQTTLPLNVSKIKYRHQVLREECCCSCFTEVKAKRRLHSLHRLLMNLKYATILYLLKRIFFIWNNSHRSKHPITPNKYSYSWLLWRQGAGLEQRQGGRSAAKNECSRGCWEAV